MQLTIIDRWQRLSQYLEHHQHARILNIGLKLPSAIRARIKPNLIDAPALIDKDEFDRKYLNLVADLGHSYQSRFWWGQSISEKNEFLSSFYQRLFYTYNLEQFMRRGAFGELLVLCADYELISYWRKVYPGRIKIQVPNLNLWILRKKCQNYLRLLCKSVLFSLREIYRSWICRFYLAKRFQEIKARKYLLAIKTVMDHRNYSTGTYRDSYFGPLINYLNTQNIETFLVTEILQRYRDGVGKLAKEKKYNILPLEIFTSIKDVAKTLWESLTCGVNMKKEVFFEGIDITALLRYELDQYSANAQFYVNLLSYHKLLAVLRHIQFEKYLYTFENYGWEKLGIMCLRKHKPQVRITAFQHAFISKNSFRYFPGAREGQIMPLPDKIVTMGKITKEILEKFGDYSTTQLIEGCALRQEKTVNLPRIPRTGKKDIFVPLTITVEDTVKVLNFLCEAGLGNSTFSIFLRFHPITPRKKVFAQIDFSLPKNFIISDGVSLEEEFKRSGVVLYTWTTVCLEALLVGLPVIYLDINYPLNVDPLFDLPYLKRTVSKAEELLDEISALLALNQERYEQEYHQSRKYIEQYFYPVTAQNLKVFVE